MVVILPTKIATIFIYFKINLHNRRLGMKLSQDIESLLEQRYYRYGEDWPQLVDRVVDTVCDGESDNHIRRMKYLIKERAFLPNSPCLVNAGTRNSGLMACFVVGPDEDTLEHHVEVLGDIAAVGKRGGGAGFSGADIRPRGSQVDGSAHNSPSRGIAYGPNRWALEVSSYLDMITQGGFRKMALMYSLPSEHHDLNDFIKLKQNGNEKFAYNFNQSVFASDNWMEKATSPDTYEAAQLLNLAGSAHNNGEPGLLFADTINNNTPYSTCGCHIKTTNPCGEQPLPSYGSCNLGSINLAHDFFYSADGDFDFGVLAGAVNEITRFLDNVGSHNIFPNEKFEKWYKDHRPIGIGIMGFADALLRMGIAYGSEDSIYFLETIMKSIQEQSYRTSRKLGYEKGIPEHCKAVDRRNITTVSIAPTGSIAFIAGCSHGIEPVFSPSYLRTDERGNQYVFTHDMADADHFRSTLNPDKNKIPHWKEHIDLQAAAQKYTDSAVSKTINMLNGIAEDEVHEAFVYAWMKGCKGVTIYRDGSRDEQVLDDVTEEDAGLQSCPTGTCQI
jgi:ribonucleoside-diphosphate reductase alpha chain